MWVTAAISIISETLQTTVLPGKIGPGSAGSKKFFNQ